MGFLRTSSLGEPSRILGNVYEDPTSGYKLLLLLLLFSLFLLFLLLILVILILKEGSIMYAMMIS